MLDIKRIYTAVILAAYEEEKTGEDNEWHRIRLLVDLVDDDVKGYFTALFNDFQKMDKYKGVIDWYLPTAPFDADRYADIGYRLDTAAIIKNAIKGTIKYGSRPVQHLLHHPITDDDKRYYNAYKQLLNNCQSIIYYNSIDKIDNLEGLLLPIQMYLHDGVDLRPSPYFPIVAPPKPLPTYTLADFANAEEIEKSLSGYKPYGMAAIAPVKTVKGRDIVVASDSALDILKAKISSHSPSAPTTPTSLPTFPPPVNNHTIDDLVNMFGGDKLVDTGVTEADKEKALADDLDFILSI